TTASILDILAPDVEEVTQPNNSQIKQLESKGTPRIWDRSFKTQEYLNSNDSDVKEKRVITPLENQKKRFLIQETPSSYERNCKKFGLTLDEMRELECLKFDGETRKNDNTCKPSQGLMEENCLDMYSITSKFRRFLVLEIKTYQDLKILKILNESDHQELILHLVEEWLENTEIEVGFYINLVGYHKQMSSPIVLNNESEIQLIVNPDILIPITAVANSFTCLRKEVIKYRMKSPIKECTPELIYGTMLHLLFQKALKDLDFTEKSIKENIQTIIMSNLEGLYECNENQMSAFARLQTFIPILKTWAHQHLRIDFKSRQSTKVDFDAKPTTSHSSNKDYHLKIKKKSSIDIIKIWELEERFWSPMFGLNGNVDISISNKEDGMTDIFPIEVKTGNNLGCNPHNVQTMLYSMLMADRYGNAFPKGYLMYLRAGEVKEISNFPVEMRQLLIKRNTLAYFMLNQNIIPKMLKDSFVCKKCHLNTECFLLHNTMENGNAETSGLGSLFELKLKNLTENHLEFLNKWEKLVSIEEGDITKFRKEIWTMSSTERERSGRCFSNMGLIECNENGIGYFGGSSYIYQFRKMNLKEHISLSFDEENKNFSLKESQICEGDPVVVSIEKGEYAVIVGFVIKITHSYIKISGDNSTPLKTSRNGLGEVFVPDSTKYRIDKEEYTSGMGLLRDNIFSLFNNEQNKKLRSLVVDSVKPKFNIPIDHTLMKTFSVENNLNLDQKKGLEKVLSSDDYALILGMPGTGKTTMITCIIKYLASIGKRVLLTSYTHNAVDNVLLKLKKAGVDFLRLGTNLDRVHPEIRDSQSKLKDIKTVEGLASFYASQSVVATTCLGIKHVIFAKHRFDYCIVDEATQVTLPVCLGPLRFADKFVLVGDHYQLPPLVKNSTAKKNGLEISLFKLLSKEHPESTVFLEHQYRMNKEILALSNEFIYSHRLKCGNIKIEESRLQIKYNENDLTKFHISQNAINSINCTCENGKSTFDNVFCWLKVSLDPNQPVIFLNTDELDAIEQRSGSQIKNKIEADLVFQVSYNI
ncbi:Tripartite DNA replication factor, partial [Clydaea vesicula]